MKKFLTLLTAAILAFTFAGYTQVRTGRVSGKVVDGDAKIVESATITLLRLKDSSVAKISVADKTGNFVFELVPEGGYVVSISAIGHVKGYSENFDIKERNDSVVLKT